MKRIIWTNEDYDEWEKSVLSDDENADTSFEAFNDYCEIWLDDERCNLDIEVDGVIVAYGYVGTWRGVINGMKIIGTNVKDILSSNCDYVTWSCDRYNVVCDEIHHDGHNHIVYRMFETREKADRFLNNFVCNKYADDYKAFMKATKSIRPYVAKVYGW